MFNAFIVNVLIATSVRHSPPLVDGAFGLEVVPEADGGLEGEVVGDAVGLDVVV